MCHRARVGNASTGCGDGIDSCNRIYYHRTFD